MSITKSLDAEFIYERIARQLEAQIHQGVFQAGEKLPSVRKLCAQERVSATSAQQALAVLESRGLVEAKPKSGFFVRNRRLDSAPTPAPTPCSFMPHRVGVSDLVAEVVSHAGNPDLVPLGSAVPSPDLLPTDRLSRCLTGAAREEPEQFGRYCQTTGHPELIRQMQRRWATFGCHVPTAEITVTCGGMEALNLAIRAVTRPGDIVAVESPAYYGILQILESLGLEVILIPGTSEDGIDLELLADAIEQHPVKALILVPSFNNPSGSCMSEGARIKLLELLTDHDLPLVEDDIYGDLHFAPERARPVKAFDKDGRVLYCGSFSKCLSPGLRVGWVAGGGYAEAVRRLKFISTINTPSINQLAVARFLDSGMMDRHLRQLRKALQTQVLQTAEAVLSNFPMGTALSKPAGGYVLWVSLPEYVDALDVYREAIEEKIYIAPGHIFCPVSDIPNRLRLSCGYPFTDRIANAISCLGKIIRRLQRNSIRPMS
jgi:DNA-binding transcriptional MocR family regulator